MDNKLTHYNVLQLKVITKEHFSHYNWHHQNVMVMIQMNASHIVDIVYIR
jgi:hypothetical protein